MSQRVHLDFELASVLDLSLVGADVWTREPETHPICASFAIDDDPIESLVFTPIVAWPNRSQLLLNAASNAEIHAWNAPFEHAVWNEIMVPRFGWFPLPIERFHCTMAAAACAGLPMSLDDAAQAVRAGFAKDELGRAMMKRMSRPRGAAPLVWWHDTDAHKVRRLVAYNASDVEAERAVSRLIPRMSKRERDTWLADRAMNGRGMPVDFSLLKRLKAITDQELARLDKLMSAVTGGFVSQCTQAGRLMEWLRLFHGAPLPSLKKDELGEFIQSQEFRALAEPAREALLIRAQAAKTSTAKLRSVEHYARSDGWARNLVQYGGATRTLRWAGRGPQIQNFPRPSIKRVGFAIGEILRGMSAHDLGLLFGNPLDVVASCLRGVFYAPDGLLFVVCDFKSVEARIIAWLAGQDDVLLVFARGEDVYLYAAQQQGSNNRAFGKVLVLACGYGLGPFGFMRTAKGYGLDVSAPDAEDAVYGWRQKNRATVRLWYASQDAGRKAIETPGAQFSAGRLRFRMALPSGRLRGSLLMELPSGRNVVYRDARIEDDQIVYDGVNQKTHQWGPIRTYGGKLVENATQAVARDLLRDAILSIEPRWPGALRTTIHDEIVALAPRDTAPHLYADMCGVMRIAPAWAPGLPLDAEGFVGRRYGK